MFSSTKDLGRWPLLLAAFAALASLATVQSASLGAGLSRDINLNSIPGGDNDESNMVEPMSFSSITDFLTSKQGLGKKTDDASRMKALVKALYALDALDKKMADKSDASDLLSDETEDAKTEATTTVGTTASTTTTTTTEAAPVPTTDLPYTTDSPTLVHDSEVNEFVEQIAKHISTFFQGILNYFDRPNLPADATVVIQIAEKPADSAEGSSLDSSSLESGESDSKEELSTEEIPKWLVQMFESVAALPDEVTGQNKGKEFRPKEPLEADER